MRALELLLLGVFVAGIHSEAVSEGISKIAKDLRGQADEALEEAVEFVLEIRGRQFYDEAEKSVAAGTCILCDDPKLLFYEDQILIRIFLLGIMKPILVERRSPAPSEIHEMAAKLARIVRENITDDVVELASGAKWLASEATVKKISEVALKVSQPDYVPPPTDDTGYASNSSFVRELSKHKDENLQSSLIYAYAGAARCVAEHFAEILPNDQSILNEMTLTGMLRILGDRCGTWVTASWLFKKVANEDDNDMMLVAQIFIHDLLEILGDEKNAEELLNSFVVLLETITKRASYDSVETFIEGLNRSPLLRVWNALHQEELKCESAAWPVELKNEFKKAVNGIGGIARMLLPLEVEPNADEINEKLLELRPILDNVFNLTSHADSEANLTAYMGCLFPAKGHQPQQFLEALKGGDLEKEEFLRRVKEESTAWHATYNLLFHTIEVHRRRHGLSENAKQFYDKAVIYMVSMLNTYRKLEGEQSPTTTGSQATERDRLTSEIRKAFRALPQEEKKALIKHYPFASLYFLARIF